MGNQEKVSDGKAAILAAAEELFGEKGFEGVSVNAVAQRAGVSKANVFHHFSSKDDLYYAVLENAQAEIAAMLDEALEATSTMGLEKVLHCIARGHLEHLSRRAGLTRLFLREQTEGRGGRGQMLAERVFGNNFERMLALLQGAQQRGELRKSVDPATIIFMLLAANVFYFQNQDLLGHLPGNTLTDRDRYSESIVDALLNGVAGKQ